MHLPSLLLILALGASVYARDDWSWGNEDGDTPPSSDISGRSLTFPSSTNNERKAPSPAQPVSPQPESVRAPRLVEAPSVSVQKLVPAVAQSFSTPGQSLPAPHVQVQSFPPLQGQPLSIQAHAAPHAQIVQPSPTPQSFQINPVATSIQPQPVGAQLKGESKSDKPRGDGQAEARFLGLKDKFCEFGIGYDCKKGYKGHHKGGGLSVYDVSYVQPIQVVPVGGPIAAVPIDKGYKKGHHDKGHYSPPAYHPPQPAYHPPQPAYHPPSTGYGAPAPSYHPPKSSYAAPAHSSYTPPKASYGQGGNVVHHVHTHQHVYKGPSSHGGYSFGKDNSHKSSGSSHFATFSSSIKKVGSVLPAVPPRQNFLGDDSSLPPYLEDCQCVERQYCSSFDVVGRSNNRLPLLDARNKKTDILSTAVDDDNDGAAASGSLADEDSSVATDQNLARQKRDTFSFGVEDDNLDLAFQPTSRQGRQFRFGGYSPGVSGCATNHVCCRSPVFRSSRDISTCGRRSSVGLLGRVKNTRFETGDTEFGEYPWQGAILRREGNDNVYVCGAVLIDTRHLLTAAHCTNGLTPSDLKIRLGEWDVSSETEFYKYIETPVAGVYPHADFYSGNLHNDIAIIRLFSPVDLVTNPHISPVCLPHRTASFNGQRCFATGWGKNAFGDTGDFQHLLKEVDLPMVSHSRCESALRRTRLGFQFKLDEGMICAGGEEGKDACEGDGGSPLVCRGQDGSMMLAGLVSWGVGCGKLGVPGVYTNIPHYIDWIHHITKNQIF